MHSSVVLTLFTLWCHRSLEHYLAKLKLTTHQTTSLHFLLPPARGNRSTFNSFVLTTLDISQKWSHGVVVILWLACFTWQMSSRFINAVACDGIFPFLRPNIIPLCIYKYTIFSVSSHPSMDIGLFPSLGFDEHGCIPLGYNECGCANIFLSSCF